ncbi:alpha/beta fold hydrolase [Rhizobium sp. L1K21]|uniref:alpha/beta fold hydrolase n=1 Tax=Rhizobium sp. L1K21 TaxID=2954933 RepID=UPI0020924C7D|nr:alpha/beta fold hydrolase [Rhizobium sp. L1K21]MCO6186005.1 alpha/beta hydrolase [Rhizobium sp. L1K21]
MKEEFCTLPDGRRLCYSVFGEGQPLVLIAGLALHMTYWPQSFLDALTKRGFRVIVFDNRDVGKSSFMDTPVPGKLDIMLRRAPDGCYRIEDMADDVMLLLDSLHIQAAHIVGMSMGGMIAQALASHHGDKVLSLTSIFSTTGARRVGQPSMRTMLQLMKGRSSSREASARAFADMMSLIGGRKYPSSRSRLTDYASKAWDRSVGDIEAGVARQIGAIIKSGDRTEALARIKAPTLVVHGDRDLMVHPSGGRATAAAIKGARMVILQGAGHDIADRFADRLAGLILENTERAS